MRIHTRIGLVVVAFLCLGSGANQMATAQVLPNPGDDVLSRSDLIGVIPGTDMMRDEFRARGEAQLSAIALNALVHWTVFGEYPASLIDLQSSDAWNLQPFNMFTDEPIKQIFFVPSTEDLTSKPYLNIPFDAELPSAAPLGLPGFQDTDPGGSAGQLMIGLSQPAQLRVDPAAITQRSSGDVFYYTDGELLQLIMYAPDGTYVERVDSSPHMGWRARMNVGAAGSDWPFDLYLAQMLQFCDVLMPNFYNYVMYMSDGNMIPRAKLSNLGAGERVLMCETLGIGLRNPLSREPLAVEAEPRSGNFISGAPLAIAKRDGQLMTQALLDAAKPVSLDQTPPPLSEQGVRKPNEKPRGRPPLGGRR